MNWWRPPSYLCHCNCDWLNHTTWSNGNGLCIPCGMVAAIFFPVDQVMCDWLNHTTWFHSNLALPWSMEFDSMLLNFVYTIQTPICYVGYTSGILSFFFVFTSPRKSRLDPFVFRRVFLQTSCCQVGSPREIYPQVHKEIVNITCTIVSSIST